MDISKFVSEDMTEQQPRTAVSFDHLRLFACQTEFRGNDVIDALDGSLKTTGLSPPERHVCMPSM